ncbi:1ea29e19-f61a-4fbe-885c-c73c3a43b09b [Thermothielavioides terrestris]|uniref:glucan endo-1,3-beta-D-glucosidase n=2 Tax=Thermothielavioides terrestris TaxID=2587410 RepID=G2QZW9_THETT|nr:glycoside hydrolase family 17 protein [Thermothielavioides terrestris NRRL 8126]AEO65540.1 glycoside hydrolase family 17 protein [Thermothielavioides terrestris NRRL 8126]SPQ19207.1 1ea29e19-f61a-4fbe-885c-c73c3a43b09b [Thermothielavioides terrestris]
MAQPRYYSEDDMADERQPLGASIPPSPPRHRQQYQQQQPYRYPPDRYAPPSHFRPGAHPDSSFERLRDQRRYSQEPAIGPRGAPAPYATAANAPIGQGQADAVSPVSPLQESPQRDPDGRYWGQGTSYPPPVQRRLSHQSTVTPGSDNFSNAAAGGVAGIALSVAEQNARESGLNAIHGYQGQEPGPAPGQAYGDRGMLSPHDHYTPDRNSHSSLQALNAAAPGPGYSTPGQRTSGIGDIYMDDPYQNLSRHQDSTLGIVNPNDIADDGDDGLEYGRRGPRTSMLSLGSSHKGRDGAAAAGGAAAGGVLGGLIGRNGSGNVSNQYAPVNNGVISDRASGGSGSGSGFGPGSGPGSGMGAAGVYNAAPVGVGVGSEKAAWQAAGVSKSSTRGKKWRIAIIVLVLLAIIAGIVLGVLFGAVFKGKRVGSDNSGGSSSDTATAAGDTQANGDLGADSAEIQALMNNPNLRKVFPGIDYTPLNTQFPACLSNPPSQNNVTRDLAVLSQLTNVVRLYGTDCNQTEMLIHAIDRLNLKGKVKIWLGVWQDNNATTNERQLSQMWNIVDKYDAEYFMGAIVANEILFRQQMTVTQLGELLDEVRTNMTRRGLSLPVATSDLGDNWTPTLASQSDAIMANIHPFFAGTKATEAADWTMYFWGNKTEGFLKKDKSMNIISETGWPSQGGTDCGTDQITVCPDAAVAGIDELNTFMADFVCRSLDQGTNYFWFEAFDEPWKIQFDTPGKEWEDHWGLLTVDRKLKDGVNIPDCGGKRVSEFS